MNRRRARRKRLRVPVGLEPGKIHSYSGDISRTGIFVHSARVHRPGTRVRIVLRTTNGAIEADGVVRWSKRVPPQFLSYMRGGMGVEFIDPTPDLVAFLTFSVPEDEDGAAVGPAASAGAAAR